MNTESWSPYPGNRLMKKMDGYCIIIPQGLHEVIPIKCPVCNVLMRSRDDEVSWDKFKCCSNCDHEWASPQTEKWKNGWRPSLEEISDMMERRGMFTVQFDL